jgi:hypothetical protein
MIDFRDNSFDLEAPLCSFGPGGEFTAKWGELLRGEPKPQTKLGKVLAILAEVVTATAAAGMNPEIDEAQDDAPETPNIRIVKTETQKGVQIKAVPATDTKTTRIVEIGGPVPGQLLLFGIDAGAGRNAGDKQDNGVRASLRPAKKKSPFRRPRQGSLFEADPSRAISA